VSRTGVVSPVPGAAADLNWAPRVIADFNADGKPDIAWQHQVSGEVWFWYLDMFARVSQGAATPYVGTPWRIVGAR
jgi:hypothetical protein